MANEIHKSARISENTDIEVSSRGSKIHIGKNSFVDSYVKMKFAGGTADIIIGDDCYINSGCVLYSGNGIKMGDKVLVASNCTFAAVNHGIYQHSSMLEQDFMPSKGGIEIKDDVWIGANCVILDGAKITSGCIIAAGSTVRGNLDTPFGIYAGSPARFIKLRPIKEDTND